MNILILTGGSIEPSFAKNYIAQHSWDRILAADSGLEFCRAADILPDRILGDYDSARKETVHYYREHFPERMVTYPSEKDETDTELAVSLALEAGADHMTLLGATGTRVDHLLGSLQLLVKACAAGADCVIVDAHNRIRLLGRPREALSLAGLPTVRAEESAQAALTPGENTFLGEHAANGQGLSSFPEPNSRPGRQAAEQETAGSWLDSHPPVEYRLRREEQFGLYVSLLPFTPSVEGLTLSGFHYNVKNFTLTCGKALGVSNEIEDEIAQITFRKGLLLVIESLD